MLLAETKHHLSDPIGTALNTSRKDWDWLDTVPAIRLLPEPKRRVRWLTHDEADRLIAEMPAHLNAMVRFTRWL